MGNVAMTTKKGIFISHIHEEAKLGGRIKFWATDAFAGSAVTAFLSSDDKDLPAGRKWLEVIERQVSEAGVMVSVLSPTSLARPWVNIELGAAWINHVPVIPLCHSGLTIAKLPRPFGDFNAIELTQDNAASRLIDGIADALQLAHPKKLQFDLCLKELRSAAAKSELVQVLAATATPASDRPPEQIAILQMLARFGNEYGDEYVDGPDAPGMCALKPMVFKHHAEQLDEDSLITSSYWGEGMHYKITGDGAGWLIEHGLMPE
jgi:hypothetical protein